MTEGVTSGSVAVENQDAAVTDNQEIVANSTESITDNINNENGHEITDDEMKEGIQDRLLVHIIQVEKKGKGEQKVTKPDADMVVDLV